MLRPAPSRRPAPRPRRALPLAALLALLAAAAPGQVPDPAKLAALERGEVPGRREATAEQAADIFRRACLASAGDLARAGPNLIAAGLLYRAHTGTRYHGDFNLSVKLLPDEAAPQACSMVVVTRAPALEMLLTAAALDATERPAGFLIEAAETDRGVFRFLMRRNPDATR